MDQTRQSKAGPAPAATKKPKAAPTPRPFTFSASNDGDGSIIIAGAPGKPLDIKVHTGGSLTRFSIADGKQLTDFVRAVNASRQEVGTEAG